MKNERRVKTLLVLNPFPGEPLPTGRILPGNWNVSTNRELLPRATAVLFHLPTVDGCWADYLPYKIKGQIWIAWSRESGQNFLWLDELDFASLFELKMGYRKTDDILYPYYKYEYKDLLSRSRGAKNKEGDVCVLISSLLDKSGRFGYLSELMCYLPIDSYGKWMQNRLLKGDTGRNSKLDLYRKYKFVIAFENAIEEDYVTEKFYDPLLAGSVPVYLGAPNIRDFQPGEHCFVDVNVFDSPKELAGFLKDCCRDDCLYEQFHSWRNVPLSPGFVKMVGEQKSDPFLRVCRQIDDYLATNSLAPFPAIESWKGNTERNIVVSVVMPVYNQEKYVRDAIESILNQTFQDFELIVVNDGSDDDSESKILSCRDERIVYVRNEENQGNYPARNIGIAKAKGRYVAVMDADDLAFPTRLEQQFTYLENHRDLCAVGSGFTFSDTLRKCRHPLGDEEIRLALLDRNSFMHASLMIRMEALRELGGYNETYRYASDYDLVCRLVLYGKVENLPDILMIYRCHPDQISQKRMRLQQMYAEQIRTHYRLSFSECYGGTSFGYLDAHSLRDEELGKIITLYIYARYKADGALEREADRRVNQVCEKMGQKEVSGLFDVACGFLCLLRNGFVEGEEDVVLANFDRQLDWLCLALKEEDRDSLYGWIHYLLLRIENKQNDDLNFIRNKQNLICLLSYLDCEDVRGDDILLTRDLGLICSMRICPVVIEKLSTCEREDPRVTIVIPVRIDSEERSHNLDWVIEHLSHWINTSILVLEADEVPHYWLKEHYENVRYFFVEDHDRVFHRTHYLNRLIRMSETCIVGVWDTDVFVPEKQKTEAVRRIANGTVALCYPYDGRFCSLSEQKSLLVKAGKKRFSGRLSGDDVLSVMIHSFGGAFFIDRKLYLQAGGENEHFYGWGCEDLERVRRMEILGLSISRTSGTLYHLYHSRNENSWFADLANERRNRVEYLNVCGMDRAALLEYIRSWSL